jgi:uncharacterized membrane protein SpoIIM required for sporulation
MISTHWIEKRRPHWTRLEQLLEQSRRQGLKSLTRGDLRELGLLYRQAAADLAAIREDRSSIHFAHYLNQLLARAHNNIYSGSKGSPRAFMHFFVYRYPRIFQANLAFVIAATGLFLLGAVVGALLTLQDPDFQLKVLGPRMVETIVRREMWTHSIVGMKPIASTGIMTNNLSVSFTAFAFGITAGLGTIYMMVFNGLMLGVIGVACGLAGMSMSLWSFVAPHGVLELPAIFIAGGAGLRIAHGLLFPGTLPRRDSLVKAGGDAVRLLVGCIPLLVIAGIIEGFVSPTGIPVAMKFTMAAALFVLLIAYLWSPNAPTFNAEDAEAAKVAQPQPNPLPK